MAQNQVQRQATQAQSLSAIKSQPSWLAKLPPVEQRMYAAKYTGKRFGAMDNVELATAVGDIVPKICAVAGWKLDEDEGVQIWLAEATALKLSTQFSSLTPSELLLAVTLYPAKDFGRNFNMEVLHECLTTYLPHRSELSRIEEQKNPLPTLKLEDGSQISDEELLNSAIWLIKANLSPEMISVRVYHHLEKERLISPEKGQKQDAMKRARERVAELCEQSDGYLAEVEAMDATKFQSLLVEKAKQFLTADYIRKMIENESR